MPINSDFIAFHQALSSEFNSTKDQVRNLIGDSHWPSDGGHKEAILRKVLQNKLPNTFQVGTVFFADTLESSSQIDILVTDASKPTLFRNGDFLIVTPDCVKAVIEVKTQLESNQKIKESISNLAINIQRIRNKNPECWAGLFVFEGPTGEQTNPINECSKKSEHFLSTLYSVSNQDPEKIVNCISLGGNTFIRYWPNGTEQIGGKLISSGWHSYIFRDSLHHNLSPSYFVGNLVMHLTNSENTEASRAWFPIQDGFGKETYRIQAIHLENQNIIDYTKN